MANRIRTIDPREFNKGGSSKFHEGSWVRQTPEDGWRTYQLKRCENNNKDEDNSPKTLNDKNQQASFQKFRQLKKSFFTWTSKRKWEIQQFHEILITATDTADISPIK